MPWKARGMSHRVNLAGRMSGSREASVIDACKGQAGSNPPGLFFRTGSSAVQSRRLIIDKAWVRIPPGPFNTWPGQEKRKETMRECQPMAPSTRRTPDQVTQSLAVYLEAEREARRAANWALTLLALEEALPSERRRPEMTWPPPAEIPAAMEPYPGAWKKGLEDVSRDIKVDLENTNAEQRSVSFLEEALRNLAHDVASAVRAVAHRRAVRTYGHWPTRHDSQLDNMVVAEFDILAGQLIKWINEQRKQQ